MVAVVRSTRTLLPALSADPGGGRRVSRSEADQGEAYDFSQAKQEVELSSTATQSGVFTDDDGTEYHGDEGIARWFAHFEKVRAHNEQALAPFRKPLCAARQE